MTKSKQTLKEEYFFERFRKLYKPVQSFDFVKTESPDFISTNFSHQRIGIEITDLINTKENGAKYSPAQRHSLEKKIVEIAEKDFISSYNIPLHSFFWFKDDFICRKGDESILANILKNSIWDLIKEQNFSEYFHLSNYNPNDDFLISYYASHFPNIKSSVWYNTKPSIVPNPEPQQLIDLIKSKEKKINLYRQKVNSVYLLILEGILPVSWFDDFTEIINTKIETKFEKVFILRSLYDYLIEIK